MVPFLGPGQALKLKDYQPLGLPAALGRVGCPAPDHVFAALFFNGCSDLPSIDLKLFRVGNVHFRDNVSCHHFLQSTEAIYTDCLLNLDGILLGTSI